MQHRKHCRKSIKKKKIVSEKEKSSQFFLFLMLFFRSDFPYCHQAAPAAAHICVPSYTIKFREI